MGGYQSINQEDKKVERGNDCMGVSGSVHGEKGAPSRIG